jgi:hypothetical protein
MAARPFLGLAVLALAACSSADEVAEDLQVEDKPAAEATAKASARSAEAVKVREETKLFLYEYAYPAQAAAIPALAAVLDARGAKARDEMIGEVEALAAEEDDPEFPVPQHMFEEDWQVVADLPGWLSLSGFFSTYTGGAHGMYGMEGYVWDKQRGRGMASEELFHSPDYLGSTMGNRVCEALNKEREERRGEPVGESDDLFNGCPDLSESTILVGSSNGKTFDRITVWFGPYVAGPWVEGAYELDFPMTREMLEAVKPAYRAAFSAKK